MLNWVRWCMAAILMIASIIVTYEFSSLRHEIWYATHAAQVNEIRAKLIEIWVAHHVSPNALAPSDLVGVNPVRLLSEPLQGYVGEFNYSPNDLKNAWFFNLKTHCLVHVLKGHEQIGYRLEMVAGKHEAGIGMLGRFDLVKSNICNNK